MDSSLDPFADMLADPVTTNARAGGKFQPKAKPRPRNNVPAPVPLISTVHTKEKVGIEPCSSLDTKLSVQHVDTVDNKLKNQAGSSLASSAEPGFKELAENNQNSSRVEDDNVKFCSGIVSLQDVVVGEEASGVDTLPSEAVSSEFDVDLFADFLPAPATSKARAGGKFQPKGKPQPQKESLATNGSAQPDGRSEKPATSATTTFDKNSDRSSDIVNGRLADPVGLSSATAEDFESRETSVNGNLSCLGVPFSAVHDTLGIMDSSELVATDALNSDIMVSNHCTDSRSAFGRSSGESVDIFCGLESFDHFPAQATFGTVSAASKTTGDVSKNAQPANKFFASDSVTNDEEDFLSPPEMQTLLASNDTGTQDKLDPLPSKETAVSSNDADLHIDNGRLHVEETGTFLDLDGLDIMSESTPAPGWRAGKFQPRPKAQTGKGKSKSNIPLAHGVESGMCPPDGQSHSSETRWVDESSIPVIPPDPVLDYSTLNWNTDGSNSISQDSELPVTEEPENVIETLPSDVVVPGDDVHSDDVSGQPEKSSDGRKRKASTSTIFSGLSKKSFAPGEEFEGGRSSRWREKNVAAPELVDESGDEAHDNGDSAFEPPMSSFTGEDADSDDDEYRVESTSGKKKASRKSNQPATENERPVRRKRKGASEEQNQSNRKSSKKFSHSTRRNRRHVDKTLLETPEDEIDHQRVPLKDLILLAEYKERLAAKEAKSSKTPLANQSTENPSHEEEPYNGEDYFASEQGRGSTGDETSSNAQASTFHFNYQSYMKRTPKSRWSKQETELFYEAIRQFGTDLSMIQQLFPGRTRHQVKLKYKKEERLHPLRLSEAVATRAKDHSHFETVIEQLKQVAAQSARDSKVDEDGVELSPEKKDEAAKYEQDEDVAAEDGEEGNPVVHSPEKFEYDINFDMWNSY